jgi:hypothetical protein
MMMRPVSSERLTRQPAETNERKHGLGMGVAVFAVVLATALVRLLAARGDLWLDEIWTLDMLARLKSPLEILTRLHHDNNHVLNSIVLWCLRGSNNDFALRLPAVFCGSLAVAAAAWSGALGDAEPAASARARQTPDLPPPARALVAALLVGGSYLLVHYGSEARGYAYALGFGVLAFACAQRGALAPRSRWAFAYGACALLALLGHALAAHLVTGVACWSLARSWRRGLRGIALLSAFALWNTLPLVGTAAFYFGFVRRVAIGGGPRESVLPVLGRAVAYACGLPLGWGPGLLLGAALLVVGAGLFALARRGADIGWAFLVTILVSPVVLRALQPSELNFERYFVLSAAFGLLLVARLLGFVAARGRAGALIAALLALVVVGGSAPRIARLLAEQRGHYRQALGLMLSESSAAQVSVSSDHDFRNGLLLRHFAERLRVQHRVAYVPQGTWTGSGPDWFIEHRLEGQPGPADALQDPLGNRYTLYAEYPSAPLSGFRWYLFRRVERVGE